MSSASVGPLAGVRVVEVALGTSDVGAGLATHLPGRLFADLGASVTRVRSAVAPTLDAGVEFARVWDRDKEVVAVSDGEAADRIGLLAGAADVLFLAGSESAVERRGLTYAALHRANPRLVVVRLRPSRDARGGLDDLELLVQARAGVLTQINGHGPGPTFGDLAIASAGAGLSATVGALAALYERESTGVGGWAETSLLDGLQAILPMILGRVAQHSPTTTLLWKNQGPAESLCYRCADGEYVQLWFGAAGAYESFLEHMAEPPTEKGYNADLMSGAMVERGKRWSAKFATEPRDHWLAALAGQRFRCEPVWRPGEALRDAHVRETGLAVAHDDPDLGELTVLGPTIRVTPSGEGSFVPREGGRLLSGVRVLDLSAYLAGPVAPLVLAELGADVVKVEPTTGDVHRNMQPMFAAGQRGKRAVALDLKSPDAAEVLAKLFAWSDVVHHNSRVGLAEKLGYDEATVRQANPDAVYSFASGFGETGPRAKLPSNDQLMQALAGIEAGQSGAGQPPTFLVWGAVDVTGGWMAAAGILAGLYARRRSGAGQTVSSSLLGAGLTLKSGAFLRGDETVGGPVVDHDENGYGAAYRIYEGADGAWFALAAVDAEAWSALRRTVGVDKLSETPPPLRTDDSGPQEDEVLLAEAFRARPASEWVSELASAGVPVEPVVQADRTGFVNGFVDDPVNRQRGRVASYPWGDLGLVEQPVFPPQLGPEPQPRAAQAIPGLGEHTDEVLASVGFSAADRERFTANGSTHQP